MSFKSSRSGDGKPSAKDKPVKKDEPLLERFSKFDYETSNSAINILVELKAKPDLRKIAETGSTKKNRISAIKSLVEIDDKESIPILEEITRTDPEKEVRDEAGEAILKLKGESREFVEKEGIEELDIADIIDEAIDFAGVEAATEEYPEFEVEDSEIKKEMDEDVKRESIKRFKGGEEEELYNMVELAMLEGNTTLKWLALDALLESDNAEALTSIQLILESRSEEKMTEQEIKGRAVIKEKLREKLTSLKIKDFLLGGHSKMDEIVIMMHNDENIEIRKMAFHALMDYEDPKGTRPEDEAIEQVLLYLRSEDDEKNLSKDQLEFKRYVVAELDKVRDYRYFNTLVDVLRFTSDSKIIDTIVTGLYFYGDPKAISILEYTANRDDLDHSTRRSAMNAAMMLGLRKK